MQNTSASQQQPQQPPSGAPPAAPSAAGPTAGSAPLVYQQLAGGQIQMYQLPPGFVPVLVSNTGSLQPLVSIPPQAQGQPQTLEVAPTATAQANTLSVPPGADQGRRSSSTGVVEQQMVLVQPQQQSSSQPQQPQQHYQDQQQMMMIMPEQPNTYSQSQPTMEPQQPQMQNIVPEAAPVQQPMAYPAAPQPAPLAEVMVQQQQPQPPVVDQDLIPGVYLQQNPQASPQPYPPPPSPASDIGYVQDTYVQQTPEAAIPAPEDTYIQSAVPTDPSLNIDPAGPPPAAQLPVGQPEMIPPPATTHFLDQSDESAVAKPPEEPAPSPQPLFLNPADGFYDIAPEAGLDEDSALNTQGKDVSGLESPMVLQPPVLSAPVISKMPFSFVVMPSTSLYSSTSSLSSNFSCEPATMHALTTSAHPKLVQHLDEYQPQSKDLILNQQQIYAPQSHYRKTSVPSVAVGQVQQIQADFLLRRGSLPPNIVLQKGEIELSNRLTSRRSSSGAIPPLATLRENHGDSDISLEDLSQVSFWPALNFGLLFPVR